MSNDRKTGYKSPPVEHQIKKGERRNPRGRPPKAARAYLPTQAVRDILAVTEEERRVRAPNGTKKISTIEAALRRLAQRALDGHGPSLRLLIQLHEKALGAHQKRFDEHFKFIEMVEREAIVSPVPTENERSYQQYINDLRKTTRKT